MIKNFLGGVVALSIVFFGGFSFAGAQGPNGTTVTTTPGNGQAVTPTTQTVTQKLENPIKYDNLNDFFAAVIKAAVTVLMPFVVVAFIWSGFLFVTAQGNEEQLGKAKTAIYWTTIGAFILLGAYGFAQIISRTVSTITS